MPNKPAEPAYTLTVYVAAPGTPLYKQTPRGWVPSGEKADVGHVYYRISDGTPEGTRAYGFAPDGRAPSPGRHDGDAAHRAVARLAGEGAGAYVERQIEDTTPLFRDRPGAVFRQDPEHYHEAHYERTMEISRSQYERLDDFGRNPQQHGFNTHNYALFTNSCIDFTWAALNHAGLHRRAIVEDMPDHPGNVQHRGAADPRFEGDVAPVRNIDDLRSIPAPFPDSPLNREILRPLPEMSAAQRWLLTEAQLRDPAHPLAAGYGVIREQFARWDAEIGKPRDARTENAEASVLRLAVESGLKPEWVLKSIDNGRVRAGENVFVGEGDPHAAIPRWAMLPMQQAVATPAAESLAAVARHLESRSAGAPDPAHAQPTHTLQPSPVDAPGPARSAHVQRIA